MSTIAIGERKYKCFFILILLICTLRIEAQDIEVVELPQENKQDTVPSKLPLSLQAFRIDTAFANRSYAEHFKLIPSRVNIYDMPYSLRDNYPNYKRLALNTGVLFGAGVLTLGVLYLLPEGATAWNKKEMKETPFFSRWWNNVKKGPVVDKDNFVFNYILHPYGGAAYFMSARSLGFSFYYSFLYSAAVSTFFWEYGIEAFMEIPSIQDLIITPIAGTLMGEGFYRLKRSIVANGYTLFGSSFLGNVVAYLIDPVNEVIGLFAGNPNRQKKKTDGLSVAYVPWVNTAKTGPTFGFTVNLSF